VIATLWPRKQTNRKKRTQPLPNCRRSNTHNLVGAECRRYARDRIASGAAALVDLTSWRKRPVNKFISFPNLSRERSRGRSGLGREMALVVVWWRSVSLVSSSLTPIGDKDRWLQRPRGPKRAGNRNPNLARN
jgi:hypothetical protein